MIRTGFPSQGVDLEAQPEDSGVFYIFFRTLSLCPQVRYKLKDVRGGSACEMSKRTSARDGETSGPTGGTKPEGEAEGEDQAGPPAHSQTQNEEEGTSDSSEYVLY